MNTPCTYLEVLRYPIVKTRNSSWRYRYTKKAWNPTVAVPRLEAFALPLVLKRQREAHAEYKITLVLFHQLRYACAHTHIRKRRTIIGTRGITLYPVGHLSLLSSEYLLKVAKFQDVRTKRNKRLFNMSATLR